MSYARYLLENCFGIDERVYVRTKSGDVPGLRDKEEVEAEKAQNRDDDVLKLLKSKKITYKRSDVFPGHKFARAAIRQKIAGGELEPDKATKILSRFRTNASIGKKPGNDFRAYRKEGQSLYGHLLEMLQIDEISGRYVGSVLRSRSQEMGKMLKKWKESKIAKGSSTQGGIADTKGIEAQYKTLKDKAGKQVSDIEKADLQRP